jgi:hypothetical protein
MKGTRIQITNFQTKLKSVRKGGASLQVIRVEVSKGNEYLLSMVQTPYPALGRPVQEREGKGRVLGGEEAGAQEERLRRAEVPRAYQDRKDDQEGNVAFEMQGM